MNALLIFLIVMSSIEIAARLMLLALGEYPREVSWTRPSDVFRLILSSALLVWVCTLKFGGAQ